MTIALGGRIHITEVAPRDGLQNLPGVLPLKEKLDFIQALCGAGCEEIEAASFVNPKWVPQFADAQELCAALETQTNGVVFTYLVPNYKGAQRAIDAGAKQLFVTTSASEKHCHDNLNQTLEQVLEGAERIAELCREKNVVYTASIATAFGYSPDPMPVPPERVLSMIARMEKAGFGAVTLCDTSGEAKPEGVYALCRAAVESTSLPIGVHLHQNDGVELENALAALEAGVRIFESAAGGLGGCPFIANARGNIATEKLIALLEEQNYSTGIDKARMAECAETAARIRTVYGCPPEGCNT